MHTNPPPSDLRFLKALVALLTAVMIGGILTIVGLMVARLPSAPAPLALPAAVVLPEGARAEAVTFGRDWVLVVTDGGAALVYDRATGALRQTLRLETGD